MASTRWRTLMTDAEARRILEASLFLAKLEYERVTKEIKAIETILSVYTLEGEKP